MDSGVRDILGLVCRVRLLRTLPIAAAALVVVAGARAAAQAQGGTTAWDGVYTEAQATRGQAVYKELCATCHMEDLSGGGMAASLIGDDFMGDWQGKTVGDLLERTTATMPADDPGRLKLAEAADSVAYILSRNKFPPGTTELSTDLAALKQIRITAQK